MMEIAALLPSLTAIAKMRCRALLGVVQRFEYYDHSSAFPVLLTPMNAVQKDADKLTLATKLLGAFRLQLHPSHTNARLHLGFEPEAFAAFRCSSASRHPAVLATPAIGERLTLARRASHGPCPTARQSLLSKRYSLRPLDALRMQKAPGNLVALFPKLRTHGSHGNRAGVGERRGEPGRGFSRHFLVFRGDLFSQRVRCVYCRDGFL